MNKYQEYLLRGFSFWQCCPLDEEASGGKKTYGNYEKITDTFTLTQDENINIFEYVLIVMKQPYPIEKVYTGKDETWREIEITNYLGRENAPCFRIIIDFRDRIDKIRFCFTGGLSDDYIVNLKYIEADKEAYYAKQAKVVRENLIKAAQSNILRGAIWSIFISSRVVTNTTVPKLHYTVTGRCSQSTRSRKKHFSNQ